MTTREQQLLSLILLKPAGIFVHRFVHGCSTLNAFKSSTEVQITSSQNNQSVMSGELRSFECGVRIFSKSHLIFKIVLGICISVVSLGEGVLGKRSW